MPWPEFWKVFPHYLPPALVTDDHRFHLNKILKETLDRAHFELAVDNDEDMTSLSAFELSEAFSNDESGSLIERCESWNFDAGRGHGRMIRCSSCSEHSVTDTATLKAGEKVQVHHADLSRPSSIKAARHVQSPRAPHMSGNGFTLSLS